MEFFDSMSTMQKYVLVIAAVTLVIAIVLYMLKKDKPATQQQVPIQQPPQQQILDKEPQQKVPKQANNGMVALFFADWCGHCKNMMPAWDEFASNFDGHKGVRIVKVNGQEYSDLAALHNVQGFPAIKYCPNGVESPQGVVDYDGDRSMDSFVQFLHGCTHQL